jgi:hypothetical protein
MAQKRELPYEVFQLSSSLLPQLDSIFDACDVSPIDLFVLMHLKHSGKEIEDGRRIMLRDEMTDLLGKFFKYNDKAVSRLVTEFKEKRYVNELRITIEQKERFYGDGSGRRDALTLGEEGTNKINEFTEKINNLYIELTSNISDFNFGLLTRALKKFAVTAQRKVAAKI